MHTDEASRKTLCPDLHINIHTHINTHTHAYRWSEQEDAVSWPPYKHLCTHKHTYTCIQMKQAGRRCVFTMHSTEYGRCGNVHYDGNVSFTYVCMCIYIYIYMYIHTFNPARSMWQRPLWRKRKLYVCIHIYMYVYIHTFNRVRSMWQRPLCRKRKFALVCVCMYVYTYNIQYASSIHEHVQILRV
jgi:hypothetical protein